ncbi:MAG: hypothetical protein B7Z63_01375 [Ignavibacteriae bacterium 37-53-5]|nr:MAG: hypothetical protein B7Z63_01375 [Ignavibacteriae bacterium 37-53-5]
MSRQPGTSVSPSVNGISSLDNIVNGDWALYAGVEFGDSTEYVKQPDSLQIIASCASAGGTVEVWLDSIDTGTKIAQCDIGNTGSWTTYDTFTTRVLAPVSGNHDIYLRFKGSGSSKLFMLQWLKFTDSAHPETTPIKSPSGQIPEHFELGQNFPNPFNPTTAISYKLSALSSVTLKVYDVLGRKVETLVDTRENAGNHFVTFNGDKLASGVYFYTLEAGGVTLRKKMVLIK